MKKSLSLLVAIAMVFSMFATVVSAAEEPTAGEYLNELGVILGNQDGDLKEDQTWKRQDMIVLLSRLFGAEDEAKGAAKTHEFKDVTDKNYDGYISWAVEEGLTKGKSATVFGFGDELETRDFYAFILRALGQDVDYEEVDAVAVELGLAPEDTDFDDIPLRGETYVAIVGALKTEVEPGVTLEQKLGLVKVADAVSSASAVGVKKVEVKFNAAVDTTKATFALKRGNAVVSISKVTPNDAKTAVTLETNVALTAGDYTVTVSGLGFATGKDVASFSTTAERIETVWVDDNAYRTEPLAAVNKVEVAYKLLNQYNEEVSSGVAGALNASSSVGVVEGTPTNGKVTIAGVPSNVTSLNLTVVDLKFAKSASKAVTVQLQKHIAEVTLSTPELPEGKTAFEATAKDLKLPYVAKDQYGNAVTLSTNDVNPGANQKLTFIYDAALIENVGLTADNKKLEFDIKDFNGPKTISIQVIVNATGKSSKIEFNAVGKKSINSVTLVGPSDQFGFGQSNFKVEVQANDQYGNALSAQEIVEKQGELAITSGNTAVFTVPTTGAIVKDGDKAYVQVTSPAGGVKGTALLLVTVKANSQNANVSLTVVDAKYAAQISVTPEITKAVKTASITLKATFTDQYGNAFKTGGDAVVVVAQDNTNFGATVANQTVTALTDTGIIRTAADHDKTTKLSFKLYDTVAHATANGTEGLLDTAEVTLTSVKSDATLTFEVEALGTIAAAAAGDTTSAYAKEVKVVGKDSSGSKVALASGAIALVTAVDPSIITVNGTKIAANADKEGDTKVNVTILKPNGDPVTQQADVKVSKAAPVVASITAKQDNNAVTKVAFTGAKSIADLFVKNDDLWFEVKDQYGVTTKYTGATPALQQGAAAAIFVTTPAGSASVTDFDAVAFNANGTWKVNVVSGSQSVTVEVTISGITPPPAA